jgi:deoxyribodipyrimidine photolyase-related protein
LISKSYFKGLLTYCQKHKIEKILLVEPTEYYVFQSFQTIQKKLQKYHIVLEFLPDRESFLLSPEEFQKQFKKPPIMEFFYRFMRKKFDILMDGKNPLG